MQQQMFQVIIIKVLPVLKCVEIVETNWIFQQFLFKKPLTRGKKSSWPKCLHPFQTTLHTGLQNDNLIII